MSASMGWTTTAQVKRVLAADARAIGNDAYYGLGYVAAGFALFDPKSHAQPFIAAPVYALTFVILYLAIRVCASDRSEPTAIFYSNLPRGRMVTFWTHSLVLGAFALAMEIVILAGVLLQLNMSSSHAVSEFEPAFFALPWLAMAAAMWLIFATAEWSCQPRLLTLFVLLSVIIGSCILVVSAQEYGFSFQALVMILLTCALQWDGARRWRKVQVGELT